MSSPRVARWILAKLVWNDDRDFFLDDIDEEHRLRANQDGPRAARRWYWRQTLLSLAPLINRKLTVRDPKPEPPVHTIFENVARDFRHAARSLRRSPAFSAIALVTLTLGIGATTIMFGLAYAIWLKPFPFANANELYSLSGAYRGTSAGGVSVADINAVAHSPSVAGVAAYGYSASIAKIGDEPIRLTAFRVSSNLFTLLGVNPAMGRTFTPDDQTAFTGQLVILSDAFWRTHFNRDSAIIGKSMELFTKPYTIVGVMPRSVQFPTYAPSDVWVPLVAAGTDETQRTLSAVMRVKSGTSNTRVKSELMTLSAQRARGDSATYKNWTTLGTPLIDGTIGSYRAALGVLLGAVGVLMLIACANIGALFLVRNTARRNELAVRATLGATRARLSLQVFAECMTLALVGGVGGVVLAYVAAPALAAMLPAGTPRISEFHVDGRLVAFAAAISIATGLLCAAVPALRMSRVSLGESLKDGGRVSVGGEGLRTQQALIVTQVALSLMLMIGAGLMLRSFFALVERDHGYSTEHLLMLDVVLPFERFSDPTVRSQAFQQITERLDRVPGVVSTGLVTGFPGSAIGVLDGGAVTSRPGDADRTANAVVHASTPEYFNTMKVPLVAGRFFTPQDRAGSRNVTIINQATAKKLWPGGSPLGKLVTLPSTFGSVPKNASFEVVGVVGDMKSGSTASIELFVPTYQISAFWSDVAIRTSLPVERVIDAVRRELRAFDPDMLIEYVKPMDQIISNSISLQRTQSVVAGLFGVLATLLSVVGLYGVVSHHVGQRRREIGIRLALGSSRSDVFQLVIKQGMVLASTGLVVGAGGAYVLVRVLRGSIFGLASADVRVFAAAAVLLLVAAFLACYHPARRAMGIDPINSLR